MSKSYNSKFDKNDNDNRQRNKVIRQKLARQQRQQSRRVKELDEDEDDVSRQW